MSNCVYFEPQTGLIRTKLPSRSNYYNYCIPNTTKAKAFADAAADKAIAQSLKTGRAISYPKTFLQWLDKMDKRCGCNRR